MIDSDTRLRVARGIAKTETEASQTVFETLKCQRGHPDKPPPTVSDGWGGIREAMVAVYGQVPAYSGVGRPPTHKQPGADWQYLQVVKQRENGRVIGTELRVIYGNDEEVLELLGKSTSYIERSHLTSCHFNSRLTRKSLAFSKVIAMHKLAATLEDVYYNFARPHKSLRLEVNQTDRRWQPHTPAMASALTDHIWTVKELLLYVPVPVSSNTLQGDYLSILQENMHQLYCPSQPNFLLAEWQLPLWQPNNQAGHFDETGHNGDHYLLISLHSGTPLLLR